MLQVQQSRIADPRSFTAAANDPLVALAESSLAAAGKQPSAVDAMIERYRAALSARDDATIQASWRAATSPGVYRCLWESLNRALEARADEAADICTQLFAIPLLVVSGGVAQVTAVPGVLPDIARVRSALERGGALGQARNLALGNALVAPRVLESLLPSRIYALARNMTGGLLDLPPAAIEVATPEEQVHLRFILGAAITAASAPSFLETGSAIGSWGMAVTRELADQLGVAGLSILPIPRPPTTLLRALAAGRRAREELAFQAFVSRVLRRFRAEMGEPEVTVAAIASGAIGVRFVSPFAADRMEVHGWVLDPLDDLREVESAILGLLRECRIERVEVMGGVVDARAFALAPAARGAP